MKAGKEGQERAESLKMGGVFDIFEQKFFGPLGELLL